MRIYRIVGLLAIVVALPVLGYGLMYGGTYVVPMKEDTTVVHVVFTLFLIAVGLSVPYWALKLVSRAAHEVNPLEREMQLRDVPKDKEQLDNER